MVAMSSKNALETIELIQIMESMAESIVAGKRMGGDLLELTNKDMDGLDEVIRQLEWKLPGAPGRYGSLKEAFLGRVWL